MRKALFLALALSTMGPACQDAATASSTGQPASGLPDRDPALACKMAQKGVVIDVRTPEEYRSGHVPGAVNLPISELPTKLDRVRALTEEDKSKPIVVYCASGRRSARAKEELLEAGYQQVTNLGGLDDWPDDCPRDAALPKSPEADPAQ